MNLQEFHDQSLLNIFGLFHLTHGDDTIVFENISNIEAASDQGAKKVFKSRQSSSLYSGSFYFSKSSK